MSSQKTEKIIIVGLDNAGKSTILLTMKKKARLRDMIEVQPTKGIATERIESPECMYHCWDFGGQDVYRDRHLEKPENFAGTDKVLYVIDVQDESRFDISLAYLLKILVIMQKVSKEATFSVFIHKFDPDLLEAAEYQNRSKELRRKLRNLFRQFQLPASIFHTSIYTVFQRIQVT